MLAPGMLSTKLREKLSADVLKDLQVEFRPNQERVDGRMSGIR
jgi:hypothetical protein